MSIAEIIEPTPERLRHARNGVDAPKVDQKTARRAHRMISVVEAIYRQHKLSENCWIAYRRFERDHMASQYRSSCISKYGMAASASTPVNQLTEDALASADTSFERRLFAEERATAAKRAVGGEPLKALMLAMDDKSTLESIGADLSIYTGKMQRQAAAMTLLQVALDRLHMHYEGG